MDTYDRHIFLYAKGHYKANDQTEDMKIIIGNRSCIKPEHIPEKDIFLVLLPIVYNYIQNDRQFIDFISDLNPNNSLRNLFPNKHNLYDFNKELLSKCLSVLRFQNIKDIPFDLGEADSNILPLKEKTK